MRLEYQLAAVGEGDLKRALRSVEAEVEANARKGTARDNRRVKHTKKTAQQEEAARVKSEQKAATAAERAAVKERKAKEREAKRGADARIREERRVAREQEKQARFLQGIRNRHFQQEERDRKKAERTAYRSRVAAAKRFRTGFGRSVASTAGFVADGVGMAAGIGGGFLASAAVANQISEKAKASQLANQAGAPGLKNQLLREAQGVRGFSGGEALGGLSAFVEKTGDLGAARKMINEMGMVAIATGTDLEDLGRTAGQAFNVLVDQNPATAVKETLGLLRALAEMGNMGAVEISDLARDFGKLGAATRAFEGDSPDLLRTMGAFAQIAVARGGAVNSADASTGAARLAADMVGDKRKKFEAILGKGGMQSATDKTKLKNPLEIMLDVLDKTDGDIMKTGNLFGQESAKIFRGLAATYSSTGGDKKTKRAAVESEFNKLAGATMSDRDLNERFRSRMDDPDLQIKEIVKEFNKQIGNELLPVVMKFIPEFAKMLPHITTAVGIFGKLASNLIDSPLASIGTIMAAKITADLAAASLGDVLKGGVEGMFGASGGEGSSVGSIGGSMINGLTIGAAGAMAIYATGVVNFEAAQVNMEQGGKELQEMRELVSSGAAATPEGMKRMRELREKLGERQEKASNATAWEHVIGTVASPFVRKDGETEADVGKRLNAGLGMREVAEEKTLKSFSAEGEELYREAARMQRDAARASAEAAEKDKQTAEKNAQNAERLSTALDKVNGPGPNRTTGLTERG